MAMEWRESGDIEGQEFGQWYVDQATGEIVATTYRAKDGGSVRVFSRGKNLGQFVTVERATAAVEAAILGEQRR